VNRRHQITMADDEVLAFLDEERILTCSTIGPRGWPHLMPLWYVVRDGTIWGWTYAKSQKVRNLERDPRATVQVEAGQDQYHLLRGVMLETEVVLHPQTEAVAELGLEIIRRYRGTADGDLADDVREGVLRQATKRVGLEFVERRRSTWDHRKLGDSS
jgi:PPOX class probable F420-dependent enzyme